MREYFDTERVEMDKKLERVHCCYGPYRGDVSDVWSKVLIEATTPH
ncbi:hypothetical protein M6B38_140800 [Iris pallida]|uniref:Uncharacterized protein n=1 Tax=Iris pallida TaxID=29817 RepID=A0AAX6FEM6_IRIPA|nr:hypothetical protein M6B38_140800 [Iris pallida]